MAVPLPNILLQPCDALEPDNTSHNIASVHDEEGFHRRCEQSTIQVFQKIYIGEVQNVIKLTDV